MQDGYDAHTTQSNRLGWPSGSSCGQHDGRPKVDLAEKMDGGGIRELFYFLTLLPNLKWRVCL